MKEKANVIKFNEIKEKTGINLLDYPDGVYFLTILMM